MSAEPLTDLDHEAQAIADDVRADMEAVDVGDLPHNPWELDLYRYLRLRNRWLAEHARIEECTGAMLRQLERRVQSLDYVYQARAAECVRQLLHGKRAKSVKTPFGTAGFRQAKELLVVEDPDALRRAWISEQTPAACMRLDVTPKIIKAELDRLYKETGELPPGCTIKPAEDRFFAE